MSPPISLLSPLFLLILLSTAGLLTTALPTADDTVYPLSTTGNTTSLPVSKPHSPTALHEDCLTALALLPTDPPHTVLPALFSRRFSIPPTYRLPKFRVQGRCNLAVTLLLPGLDADDRSSWREISDMFVGMNDEAAREGLKTVTGYAGSKRVIKLDLADGVARPITTTGVVS